MKVKLHSPNHAMYEEIRFEREYRARGFFILEWRWRLIRTGVFRMLGHGKKL